LKRILRRAKSYTAHKNTLSVEDCPIEPLSLRWTLQMVKDNANLSTASKDWRSVPSAHEYWR
jgi:hypothetical protein